MCYFNSLGGVRTSVVSWRDSRRPSACRWTSGRRPAGPKPPGVTRRLEKFMRDYHKREQALDRQKAELREERDQAIRDAYQAGLPMVDTARWSA